MFRRFRLLLIEALLTVPCILSAHERVMVQADRSAVIKKVRAYTSLWMARPERSFGSNQVVLGGMMFPESEMFMSCSIETG